MSCSDLNPNSSEALKNSDFAKNMLMRMLTFCYDDDDHGDDDDGGGDDDGDDGDDGDGDDDDVGACKAERPMRAQLSSKRSRPMRAQLASTGIMLSRIPF